ncbi:DUF4259 domain-containing protein [Actinomadura sp. 21ATH]|uniref:DUF4259 domain-containing protein n=1 Tax=Actinomadura sp. 21ATH TaxID=1735444 RepID=UPI0035C178E1
MGTWDTGPFDNDVAADFAGGLDDAAEHERPAAIRAALEDAVGAGEDEGLMGHVADRAIAAAAIVAAQCPGGAPTDPICGPEEAVPPLPEDLRELAVRALDRAVGPDSDLPELWGDGDSAEKWREGVARIRAVLAEALRDPRQLELPIDS